MNAPSQGRLPCNAIHMQHIVSNFCLHRLLVNPAALIEISPRHCYRCNSVTISNQKIARSLRVQGCKTNWISTTLPNPGSRWPSLLSAIAAVLEICAFVNPMPSHEVYRPCAVQGRIVNAICIKHASFNGVVSDGDFTRVCRHRDISGKRGCCETRAITNQKLGIRDCFCRQISFITSIANNNGVSGNMLHLLQMSLRY